MFYIKGEVRSSYLAVKIRLAGDIVFSSTSTILLARFSLGKWKKTWYKFITYITSTSL